MPEPAPKQWPLRKAADQSITPPPTMRDLWEGVTNACPMLFRMACGFATVYPTTADVERHFSRMGHIRNRWRNRMRPLAMDGVFHCQQYRRVTALAHLCNPDALAVMEADPEEGARSERESDTEMV
eukprot:GHVU01176112.1.p2 GENE.GHVU01176112.1~~GHVU01176112.1.p2  ORF type:complete len:140 (-),score=11.48 GHVU01176112.1:1203-1580(-)